MRALSDVFEGQEVAPHVIERVGAERMKVVSALLDDPVPLHFDRARVEALGYGNRLINQGPITAGYLMEMVVRFAGGAECLRSFKVRLLGSVYEGDQVVCRGTVVGVDRAAATVEIEIEARVGVTPVLGGTAKVALRD
jgi:acyl dehydratase